MSIINNNRIRLVGMTSGLDTDAIVKDLMRLQRAPLNKMKQQQQLIQWKQSEYREVYNLLNDFYRTFLNVANPATNMLSGAQYKKLAVSVSNSQGAAVSAVRISTNTDAYVGSHKLIINRLATSAKESSESGISAKLQSKDLRGDLELSGTKFNITVDGLTKEISFDLDYTIDSAQSGEAFASMLQDKIKDAFGTGINGESKVKVTYDDATGKISFVAAGGASKITLNSDAENDALAVLGIKSGASNRINLSLTLEELAQSFSNDAGLVFEADPDDENGTEKIKFIINNKEFSFTKDTKLSTVISTINNDPTVNVNMYYDSVTDKFSLVSKQTGAGTNIKITNVLGNFFGENSVTQIDHTKEGFGANGLDALVNIDGQDLVRSSNTFTEAGITYELLNALPGEEITVGLTLDVDGIYDNISNFVKAYNDLIDKIYSKFNEKYNRDYPPLTDEQKEAMKEEEIKKWEEQAKKGMLSNDPMLDKIITSLRLALVEEVPGVNETLYSIGIKSDSYRDRGKLTIDEAKLKKAIQENPDGVMNLFSKRSEDYPVFERKASFEEMQTRRQQEGLAHRVHDIIQDYVSIIMNSNGQKGFLLEKAGIAGDISDRTSVLSRELEENKKAIEQLTIKLYEKEEYYYRQFSAMEKALSQLYSQSAWLNSMFSGNN